MAFKANYKMVRVQQEISQRELTTINQILKDMINPVLPRQTSTPKQGGDAACQRSRFQVSFKGLIVTQYTPRKRVGCMEAQIVRHRLQEAVLAGAKQEKQFGVHQPE